eukprot:gene3431-3896_t
MSALPPPPTTIDHGLGSGETAATKPKRSPNQRITWDDLDPKKYYFYNILFGLTIDAFMYPLDVVRTRLQVQGSSIINQSFPHYTGTWNGLNKIHQYEGWRGFYKGFMPSETGYMTSRIVYYGVYEQFKQYMQKSDYGTSSAYLAGGLAEFLSLAIWVPFDVTTLKCQIQGHTIKNRAAMGFGATVFRNVPYSAIWWGSYENTKEKLHHYNIREYFGLPSRPKQQLSVAESESFTDIEMHMVENEDPIVHVLSGLAAACISTTLTNPLDVAKTRLQTGSIAEFGIKTGTHHNESLVASIFRRSHLLAVLKDTIQKEGVRALWKGMIPSLLTSAPYSMISILVYEEVKKLSLIK